MGPIHVRPARHEFLAAPGYGLRARGRLTGATPRARRSLARRGLPLLAALLAIALQPATPAGADQGEAIILRCTHGQSLSGFSQKAYKQALKDLNADTEEYTDCSSLIRQAQLAAAGSGGGGGGGGSAGSSGAPAVVPTPSEQRAITQAGHTRAAPVQVGNETIHPGVVHTDIASALSSLPNPLLAMLAFLLACLLLVVGGGLRNRVRARHPS
jgi:hypothetical protein